VVLIEPRRIEDPYAVARRLMAGELATVIDAVAGTRLGELACCNSKTCLDGSIADVAISPDERRLVLSGPTTCVYSLPELRLLSKSGGAGAAYEGVADVVFAPSGSLLLQAAGSTLNFFQLTPNGSLRLDPARRVPAMHLSEGQRVAVHPRGFQAATAGAHTEIGRATGQAPARETISLWDTRSGDRVAQLSGNPAAVSRLAYSTTGEHLASLDRRGGLLLFLARRGEAVTIAANAGDFAFVSDEQLAIGSQRGQFYLLDVGSSGESTPLADLGEPIVAVVAAPSGAVAAQGRSGRVLVWRSGQTLIDTAVSGALPGGLSFRDDGASLGVLPAHGDPVLLTVAGP